jgi:hypothetical protein
MDTRTIPEDQWIEFFDKFSRDHAGWLATVEVLDYRTGPHNIVEDLPLVGISLETSGTRPTSFEISAGNKPRRQVHHVVEMPSHIREAQEEDGSVDFQIEPATGPATLIHLRGPLH